MLMEEAGGKSTNGGAGESTLIPKRLSLPNLHIKPIEHNMPPIRIDYVDFAESNQPEDSTSQVTAQTLLL